jgi:uncharacterized SAM-binding protein YcdF (DUF218 family)
MRSGMKKIIRQIILSLLVLVLLLVVVAWIFPQPLLTVDSGTVKADVLVVLGGGHERRERAAELFKEHAAPRIIVSGFGDCEINRRWLVGAGVPPNMIELEPQSRTTRQNAQLVIKLLREQNIQHAIIVTSWYHSRRALACFRHYAPEIQFYSRPSYFACARADWRRKGIVRRIHWEYPKLLGYWLRYGICPF